MWNAINLKVLLVILATMAALLAGMKTLNSHLAPVKVVVISPADMKQLTPEEEKSIDQATKRFAPTKKQKEFSVY